MNNVHYLKNTDEVPAFLGHGEFPTSSEAFQLHKANRKRPRSFEIKTGIVSWLLEVATLFYKNILWDRGHCSVQQH